MTSSWLETRRAAEQMLAQTPIDQRGDIAASLVEQNAKVNASIGLLMRNELRQLADVSGGTYRFADIANTVSELRDVGGRQGGILINASATKKPVSAEIRASVGQLEGQIQLVWSHLAGLIDTSGTPEPLKSALLAVKSIYFETFAAEKKRVFAGLETGTYPFEAAELRDHSAANWVKIIALRDVAYQAADAQSDMEYAEQRKRFAIAGGGSLLALVVSAVVGAMVRRRVPETQLATMTDDMTKIAGGELSVSIVGLDRTDEIGGMARALQIFKDSLPAK